MFKLLKPLMFCLVATLLMSCVPAIAAPGAAVKAEMHASVKAAVYSQAFPSVAINSLADVAALPVTQVSVPKTKVYAISKYFGITVLSDITHRYARANVVFDNSRWRLLMPPKLLV